MLFYNKEILADSNVTSNPMTWDWSTFLAECAKIKPNLKAKQYVLGMPRGAIELGWASVGMQYDAAGTSPLTDDWRTSKLSDDYPEVKQAYYDLGKFYFDLYANGYATNTSVSLSGAYIDIIEGLVSGTVAMAYAGSWSVAEIINTYPQFIDKVGIAPIPSKTGSKDGPTAANGGWTYVIHKGSDKTQAAADFINWMLAEDAARTARYFEAAQYSKIPATNSVQAVIENKPKQKQEWLDVVLDVSDKAVPDPLYLFSISADIANIFSNIALDAHQYSNATEIRSFINGQISSAHEKVVAHIRNNKYLEDPIKNPLYNQ
jgi:multiple sugar transport system substrate-binding protein